MTPTFEEIVLTEHFARHAAEEEEEITRLAHRFWEERQRNHVPGSDLDDWLRAEAQVVREREAAIDEASEESFPASDPPAR
jgi:hypothetical protein